MPAENTFELQLQGVKGLPTGSLVSVRLGNKRRQGLLGPNEEPMRFPISSKREKMKVDVYQPVGKARLLFEPFQTQCVVHLDRVVSVSGVCETSPAAGLSSDEELVLSLATGGITAAAVNQRDSPPFKAAPASGRHKGAIHAQSYFDKHGVTEMLQLLVQALIKEEPECPYAYMQRMLDNTVRALDGRTKASADRDATSPMPPSVPAAVAPPPPRIESPNADQLATLEAPDMQPPAEPTLILGLPEGSPPASEPADARAASRFADTGPDHHETATCVSDESTLEPLLGQLLSAAFPSHLASARPRGGEAEGATERVDTVPEARTAPTKAVAGAGAEVGPAASVVRVAAGGTAPTGQRLVYYCSASLGHVGKLWPPLGAKENVAFCN